MVREEATTDNIGSFVVLSFSPTVNPYFTNNKICSCAGLGVWFYTILVVNKKLNIGISLTTGISISWQFALSLVKY